MTLALFKTFGFMYPISIALAITLSLVFIFTLELSAKARETVDGEIFSLSAISYIVIFLPIVFVYFSKHNAAAPYIEISGLVDFNI